MVAVGEEGTEHVIPFVHQCVARKEAVLGPGSILFEANDHLANRISPNEFLGCDHGAANRLALMIAIEEGDIRILALGREIGVHGSGCPIRSHLVDLLAHDCLVVGDEAPFRIAVMIHGPGCAQDRHDGECRSQGGIHAHPALELRHSQDRKRVAAGFFFISLEIDHDGVDSTKTLSDFRRRNVPFVIREEQGRSWLGFADLRIHERDVGGGDE